MSAITFSFGQTNFNNFKFTGVTKQEHRFAANEQLEFFEKKIKGDSILRIEYKDYSKSKILSVILNVKGTVFYLDNKTWMRSSELYPTVKDSVRLKDNDIFTDYPFKNNGEDSNDWSNSFPSKVFTESEVEINNSGAPNKWRYSQKIADLSIFDSTKFKFGIKSLLVKRGLQLYCNTNVWSQAHDDNYYFNFSLTYSIGKLEFDCVTEKDFDPTQFNIE